MKTTIDILEALKRHFSVESDYALGKKMGWRHTRLSNYRHGVSHLDTFSALEAAKVLNESPLKLIAIVEAERARRPDQKKAWLEVAKVALFASAMISGGNFGGPAPAQAGEVADSVYYVKRRRTTKKTTSRSENFTNAPLLAASM